MKNEIDLLALVKRVITKYRKQYLIYVPIVGVIAIIYAYSLPRYYTTTVQIIPEASSGGLTLPSEVSSLASMAGIKIGGGSTEDAIFPELYPDIFNSTTFLIDLFPIKVTTKDNQTYTYYDYLSKGQKSAWWMYPLKQIGEWLSKGKDSQKPNEINPFELTADQEAITKAIISNLSCNIDRKTGMITLSTTAQDPKVSAILADSVTATLQEYIIRYRTQKVRTDLAYVEKLYRESQQAYTEAQHRYASYADANKDIILASYKMKEEQLENEMQLSYNVYSQISQQLQLAKAKLQERTPAFTVIQAAVVPLKPAGPRRMFTVAGFIFLAIFVMSCKYLYVEIRQSIGKLPDANK